jgi:hypothetical protein
MEENSSAVQLFSRIDEISGITGQLYGILRVRTLPAVRTGWVHIGRVPAGNIDRLDIDRTRDIARVIDSIDLIRSADRLSTQRLYGPCLQSFGARSGDDDGVQHGGDPRAAQFHFNQIVTTQTLHVSGCTPFCSKTAVTTFTSPADNDGLC